MDIPLNAMMLSMAVQLVLGLVYFGSYAAFNAFNGSGVIFLTLSYVMPIATSFFRGRKAIYAGSFNLGMVGAACNVVSIGKSERRSRQFLLTVRYSVVCARNTTILDAFRPTGHN